MDGISIIICCYNSAARINETLEYIFSLNIPGDFFCEVILVDNNSTDNTKHVALTAQQKYSHGEIDFRIVAEYSPGLTSARSKGIQESKYELVLFCDDDNHLDPNYVMLAKQIFNEDASVGIIGGWSKPKLPVNPGEWIKDFYPALAIGKQAPEDGYVDWVFGAGMVLKKEIFEELRREKISLMLSDRVGSKQTSGGDAEICVAARFLGYKIYYSEKLILYHQISAHRLTAKSFIKANYRNIFPLIYLYLMQGLTNNQQESVDRMYSNFFRERISLVFHFLPRMLLGRHRFYSFMMAYQNVQLFFWLLTRKDRFERTAFEIKKNLYPGEQYDRL